MQGAYSVLYGIIASVHGMDTAKAGTKRKRTVLTLEKKLEILKELQRGSSQRAVGDKFNVPKSTVADIWKDRQKITDAIAASESPEFSNKKRRIIRSPTFD